METHIRKMLVRVVKISCLDMKLYYVIYFFLYEFLHFFFFNICGTNCIILLALAQCYCMVLVCLQADRMLACVHLLACTGREENGLCTN